MRNLSILGLVACTALAAARVPASAGTGNSVPPGAHYNLNLIGAPDAKNANFDGGNGARIFVRRSGQTQFYVHGGTAYAVLDHDGTDGKVGSGLADPGIVFPYDATLAPTWRVDIYVRLVGPKGSEASFASYYYDEVGDVYVPWASFVVEKDSKFALRTGDLLANGYQDMLWTLDAVNDFRICQMRIFVSEESGLAKPAAPGAGTWGQLKGQVD